MHNIDQYFQRIGYDGDRKPTLDVLREIVSHHTMSIPFENIASATGTVPDISIQAVHEKLVQRNRGGYCYEQNALLNSVLTALGFNTTCLSARVRYRLPLDVHTPRSHMMLVVDLDEGRYLTDVGFGGLTPTAPIKMVYELPQETPHETYRFVKNEDEWLLQAMFGESWENVYRFDMSPHLAADYDLQNWNTATRPDAMFKYNLIITRPVIGGRYALVNQTLTYRATGGKGQTQPVRGVDELEKVLREIFSIEIDDRTVQRADETASNGNTARQIF